jgi:hypothetical protein
MIMRYLLPLALLVPGLLGGCDVVDHSATDGVSTTGEVRPSDMTDKTNSAVNARDRDSSSKTPIDQNENQKDINVTADIRKRQPMLKT